MNPAGPLEPEAMSLRPAHDWPEAVRQCQIPHEVIAVTVHGVRVENERYHDVIQVMVGILWFYLGHQAWHLLTAGQQWSWDDAERWLGEQAATALLDPGPKETPLAYATS